MILGETNNLCSKNDNYNASVEALDNIQEEAKILYFDWGCRLSINTVTKRREYLLHEKNMLLDEKIEQRGLNHNSV